MNETLRRWEHAGFVCELRRAQVLGWLLGYVVLPPEHPWAALTSLSAPPCRGVDLVLDVEGLGKVAAWDDGHVWMQRLTVEAGVARCERIARAAEQAAYTDWKTGGQHV